MLKPIIAAFCLLVTSAHAEDVQSPYDAPAIEGIASWINSEPLTMDGLKGKVVLIDFWAYSCVNCVRTLPYLVEWDKKYREKGLVIIGMHAPEFDFEKDAQNVQYAVSKWHITYPVALDNDHVTWGNFKNRYWPAHYLISKEGKVVYTHFGEGKYEVTENTIRALLGLAPLEEQPKAVYEHSDQTPETYLGYERMAHFRSVSLVERDKQADYRLPEQLANNSWALKGKWTIERQHITANEKGAALRFSFTSKKVFLVLGTFSGKPLEAAVTLNGKPVDAFAGKDAPAGKVTVAQHALYELVAQDKHQNGLLEITAQEAGLQAYAFTFGE